MSRRKWYPDMRNQKPAANTSTWQGVDAKTTYSTPAALNLAAPVQFKDARVQSNFDKWSKNFEDEWINGVANIGAGNSIIQHSKFINERLSYAECAFLASDSIINNALSKIANEILRKGGKIVIEDADPQIENQIKKLLEKRLSEVNFWSKIHKAIITSLTYGGALIFIDTNTQKAEDLEKPLYDKVEFAKQNKIQGLRVIEPYLAGGVEVNTSNPLNADYMKPSKWFVSGGGVIAKSRLISLVIYQSPDMIKPLYNYLGISLCQFMRDYVMSADVARQALSDIFLRFRTIIIQSDLAKINTDEGVARMKVINKQRNNAGTLLLTNDEKYYETVTALTGLDKLIAQMQENIAVSARMPAVKLLGLTPSGFNATGDFDLISYYDEIMSLQNSTIKPIIERFLRYFAVEAGYDINPKFEFENLNGDSALASAQITQTETQTVSNMITAGIITQEQGFNYLQSKEIIEKSEKFSEDELGGEDFDSDLLNEDLLDVKKEV